jgi:hypothetical protein
MLATARKDAGKLLSGRESIPGKLPIHIFKLLAAGSK